MYSFRNDYSEGAHPQVLQALTDTNLVQTCGYGPKRMFTFWSAAPRPT